MYAEWLLPDVVVASRVIVCALFYVNDAAKGILAADEVDPELPWGQIKDLHATHQAGSSLICVASGMIPVVWLMRPYGEYILICVVTDALSFCKSFLAIYIYNSPAEQ